MTADAIYLLPLAMEEKSPLLSRATTTNILRTQRQKEKRSTMSSTKFKDVGDKLAGHIVFLGEDGHWYKFDGVKSQRLDEEVRIARP